MANLPQLKVVKLHHFGKLGTSTTNSPKVILHVQYIAHCDVHFASDIAPYRGYCNHSEYILNKPITSLSYFFPVLIPA